MLAAALETLITRYSPDGRDEFFDPASLPWVAGVEAAYPQIRAELLAVLQHRPQIPNFQDLSTDQAVLTAGDDWKTFFFHAYGHAIAANCARCPQTARVLQSIPGMKTAMFSILAPHKHIPEHRGPYKGVLRYHLGLLVPQPAQCGIRVGSQTRSWREGGSLVFDDSHPHEAWNGGDQTRVVLFVDFLRPLPWWLDRLNRAMVWRLGTTDFVQSATRRARTAAKGFPGGPPAG
jgi:ornithine lipid ester-linked acyl 2-hydroxylase